MKRYPFWNSKTYASRLLLATFALLLSLSAKTLGPQNADKDMIPSMDLTNGLVAYYSFDDGTATDNSGNGNNGTIHGNPQVVNGVKNSALKFDGVKDYIEVPNSASLNASQLSMSAWISAAHLDGQHMILNKEAQYEMQAFGVNFDDASPNEIGFAFNPYWYWFGSRYFLKLNEFVHVAVTFDSSQKAIVYVNGSETREIQYSGGISPTDNCIRIGARGCSSGYGYQVLGFYNGIIDEIRLYNRVLTSAEVQALYHQITFYAISGRVTDSNNNPISGVTVSDGAGHTATTDSNGNYTLSGLAAGTYTITPSKSGYTFSPSSRTIPVPPARTGLDFVITSPPPSQSCTILNYYFSQNNDDWASKNIDTTDCIFGGVNGVGCAVTSAAMVFSYYGANLNPPELGDCMGKYACPFYWTKGLSCAGGKATGFRQDDFTYPNLEGRT